MPHRLSRILACLFLTAELFVSVTRYKVWRTEGQRTDGVTEPLIVAVNGFAKPNRDGMPHVVACELICNHLARAILLPTPPGFILEKDGILYFASLDVGATGDTLPPVIPPTFVKEQPILAAGILLFDIWVMNRDRHDHNMYYNTATKQVEVFDHSHTLLINEPIEKYADDLSIGNRHCIALEINDLSPMEQWLLRINSIPDYFLESIVKSTVDIGLPDQLAQTCLDVLIKRRDNLHGLVFNNQAAFPQLINGWLC